MHRLGQRTGPRGLDSPAAGRGRFGAYPAPTPGACRRGYAPPDPRVLFPRRKSTQKGARETLDPIFVQSVNIRIDTGQPPKYLFASGSLVIGAVGIPLRLTALGMRVFASICWRESAQVQ